jgi:adenylyltransferase/sulfurtransferase
LADVIHIAENQIAPNDRFDRFKLISWWDQNRLKAGKVLVVGAGALGNEIVKNLALLGVGNILVADMDTIEASNLSRSVLFRESDCGRKKAEVAAAGAKQIYPAVRARAFVGNVVYDMGLGVLRWADVIIGGLDNREARVAINRAASRAGKIWIDGAIERLDGVARVFNPAAGPCYECTMSDVDWQMLEARRSCALLSRQEMIEGKVPTTPTTSSVVAGIQCQEAVKVLHGMETMQGGFVFNGRTHESYLVRYRKLPDCPSHEAYTPVEIMPGRSDATTVGEMLSRVRADLGGDAVIELNQDVLGGLECPKCNTNERILASLGKVTEAQGRCPRCGEHRVPHTFHTIDGSEDFLDRTIREIGVPAWDVLAGRRGLEQRFYEFREDSRDVLGELAPADSEAIPT